ncbi:MAG: WYL domain-containing protein [Bacteroidales bacterium]|nr:WYL domain-containing protein [Bacteroidales bacterium]
MPIDRNKMLRYQVLNRCFQDTSRRYRVKDLLECCNREMRKYDLNPISVRTIQKDLQDLQAEPYNVLFDPEMKEQYYYRYCDTSYTLELLKLTAPDHDALTRTIDLLRERYCTLDEQNPQWQWMLTTLQAIADGRPLDTAQPYVSFENNSAFAGNAHFATLLESIINRHPVIVRYKPYQQPEPAELKIHPYYLKQFNSRWFLFAAAEGHDTIMNLALDRILTIRQWRHPYREPEVDFQSYFADMIGVSRNADMAVEQIVLLVSNQRYPYVETKPFSEHQRILHHDGQSHTIAFPMRVNNELVAEILSFGADIEVLQPQHLRQRIAETVAQMQAQYQ